MKRLVITAGIAVAAAVPAALGLIGNASFAQSVPVHVPERATLLDDRGSAIPTIPSMLTVAADDHGGLRSSLSSSAPSTRTPGPTTSAAPEVGDDNGGLLSAPESEPGDDNGGLRSTQQATEASADAPRENTGGPGTDDPVRHGVGNNDDSATSVSSDDDDGSGPNSGGDTTGSDKTGSDSRGGDDGAGHS